MVVKRKKIPSPPYQKSNPAHTSRIRDSDEYKIMLLFIFLKGLFLLFNIKTEFSSHKTCTHRDDPE
jgi:hypothetical protein